MKEVSINESIPSPYLERYEPTKGKKDIVFICTPKKWITDIHYSEQLKMAFHCFDGDCCKVFPQKSTYTIYLIAQYVDRDDPNSKLVLKFLKAGRQLDEAIRAISEQFKDPKAITGIDLTLTLDTSKSQKFKMISVTPCVDGKRKASKGALVDLKEQIKAFLPNLSASVASVISPEEFRALCEQNDIEIPSDSVSTEVKKVAKKVEDTPVDEPIDPESEETEPSTENEESTTEIPQVDFDLDDLIL